LKKINGLFNCETIISVTAANMVLGLTIQGISVLLPVLQQEFNISKTQAGMYFSIMYSSSLIFTLFSGLIIDFIGSKSGLIAGFIWIGISVILHSLVPDYSIILFFAFLVGMGHSIITPASSKAINCNILQKKRALAMGISQSGKGIGGFFAALLFPFFAQWWGRRVALIISGVVIIALGVLIRKVYSVKNKKLNDDNESLFRMDIIKVLFTNKRLLITCLIGFSLGSVGSALISHLILFFYNDLQLGQGLIPICFVIFQIGEIVGRPLWGFLNNNLLKGDYEKSLLYIGYIVIFLFSIIGSSFYLFNIPLVIIMLFSFILGFAGRGWSGLLFSNIGDIVVTKNIGIATGIVLVFTRVGLLVSPLFFGFVADLTGSYQYSWGFYSIILVMFMVMIQIMLRRHYER